MCILYIIKSIPMYIDICMNNITFLDSRCQSSLEINSDRVENDGSY